MALSVPDNAQEMKPFDELLNCEMFDKIELFGNNQIIFF